MALPMAIFAGSANDLAGKGGLDSRCRKGSFLDGRCITPFPEMMVDLRKFSENQMSRSDGWPDWGNHKFFKLISLARGAKIIYFQSGNQAY